MLLNTKVILEGKNIMKKIINIRKQQTLSKKVMILSEKEKIELIHQLYQNNQNLFEENEDIKNLVFRKELALHKLGHQMRKSMFWNWNNKI